MEERITLDMLNSDSVSIKKQKYYNGEMVGDPHREAVVNNNPGRQIIEGLGEPYMSAIFSVWGDTPTVAIEEEIINLGVKENEYKS